MFKKRRVFVFLQNERMDFFREDHNRQFFTRRNSSVIEVLRIQKLAFETMINYAEKYWKGDSLN